MYAGALCDIHKLTEGILHRPLKTASDRKTLPCGFSLDPFLPVVLFMKLWFVYKNILSSARWAFSKLLMYTDNKYTNHIWDWVALVSPIGRAIRESELLCIYVNKSVLRC